MNYEKYANITDKTLNRLRQIRGAVLAHPGIEFKGDALTDTENLTDGLVRCVLSLYREGGNFQTLLNQQERLIRDTDSRWGNYRAAASYGVRKGEDIAECMDLMTNSNDPLGQLVEDNGIRGKGKPEPGDIVVTALSSGALLLRYEQALKNEQFMLACGIVDTTRNAQVGRSDRTLLPGTFSWPKTEISYKGEGNVWILDDSKIFGNTRVGMAKEVSMRLKVPYGEIIF